MDVFSLIPRVTSLKLFYYRPVKTLASCGSRRISENESRDALRVFRTNASLELRRTRFVTRDHLETNHKKVGFFDEERALSKYNWQVTGQTICLSQARSNELRSTAGERCHQQSQVVDRTSAKVSGERSENIFSIETSLQRRASLLFQGRISDTKTRPLLPVDPQRTPIGSTAVCSATQRGFNQRRRHGKCRIYSISNLCCFSFDF